MPEVMDQAEFQTLVLERLEQNSEFQKPCSSSIWTKWKESNKLFSPD